MAEHREDRYDFMMTRRHGPTRLFIATLVLCGVPSAGRVAIAAATPLQCSAQRRETAREIENKISPFLMRDLMRGGPVEMMAILRRSPDLDPAGGLSKPEERRRYVYDALRASAMDSQRPLVASLRARGYGVTQFWLVNGLLVSGNLSLAYDLAALPEVDRIDANPLVYGLDALVLLDETRHPDAAVQSARGASHAANAIDHASAGHPETVAGIEPTTARAVDPVDAAFAPAALEWGVEAINADDVWSSLGVRGEGIVVASCDTGVDWTHPAIRGKYRGTTGQTADHTYSWHDPIQHTTTAFDDHGHGTHTTGTMTGDDGAGNQIGVAPGAKWIGCRNMNVGNGTPATYLECMQWALAPYPEGADPMTDGRPDLGADITNNSWGCPPSEGCNAFTLQDAFENLRAAGQMTVAAAGNGGTACSTVNDPPGIYDAVFSVGALFKSSTDGLIRIASYSSRGPVNEDGSNRMKPNVAAPGSSVRSSVIGTGYGTSSGTSMASPHTAGAMALLWSARPQLRSLIRISRCYLEQSAGPVSVSATGPATCGGTTQTDRPNHFTGWGLINALAAVNLSPDTDGDGIANACDCAPGAPSSFDPPPEVANDQFGIDLRTYSWDSLAPLAGPGTAYDVARGSVAELKADGGFLRASCASSGQPGSSFDDPVAPAAGQATYYVVRGRNACALGTYGKDSDGTARAITSCP